MSAMIVMDFFAKFALKNTQYMKFSDIPAHENIKERLRALVDSDRIPHALLLAGTPGIGKFAMARALAQYIHCENRVNGDSCGVCPACIQHQSFNHIDTYFSFPVLKGGKSTAVSDDYISEWREFLTDNRFMNFENWLALLNNPNGQPKMYVEESSELIRKLNFTSHSAKYKIILMWLPERMNAECANKLLKLIEEPHHDTLFIMVSNSPEEILPTIFSRTQMIEMRRLSDEVIAGYLMENYSIGERDAAAIAHLAEGSILNAEKQLSMNDEQRRYLDLFMQLMRLAYQRKVADLRKWSVEVAGLGREQEMRFMEYCSRLIRENFIYNLHVGDLVYLNNDEFNFSKKFAPFINERNVLKLDKAINDAMTDIAGNGNAKIILFDLAVKVILLLKN